MTIFTFPTSYGHQVAVRPVTGDGAVLEVTIGAAPGVDGFSPHLDLEQAGLLAAALTTAGDLPPAPTADQTTAELEAALEAAESTDRGFIDYGTAVTVDGRQVVVRESSAATGPHVWVFPGDIGASTRDRLRLDAAQAKVLRDAVALHVALVPLRWGTAPDEVATD